MYPTHFSNGYYILKCQECGEISYEVVGENAQISKELIEKYDITLDIDRDRKIDVTEVITIDIPKDSFNGIYK